VCAIARDHQPHLKSITVIAGERCGLVNGFCGRRVGFSSLSTSVARPATRTQLEGSATSSIDQEDYDIEEFFSPNTIHSEWHDYIRPPHTSPMLGGNLVSAGGTTLSLCQPEIKVFCGRRRHKDSYCPNLEAPWSSLRGPGDDTMNTRHPS
jgi:hypothetical protein